MTKWKQCENVKGVTRSDKPTENDHSFVAVAN